MMVMSNIVFSILFVFYIYLGLLFFVFWYVSDVLLGLLCIYIYVLLTCAWVHFTYFDQITCRSLWRLDWNDLMVVPGPQNLWHNSMATMTGWWYTYPSEKIWVRQLGWLSHIWNGNIKFMFESTNQMRKSRKSHETRLWQEWNIIQHSHLLHHLP